MINKRKIIVIGILIGMLVIFFLPIFPVPLENKQGIFSGFMFVSGIMQIGLSFKSLVLLELLGGNIGFLCTFFYCEVKK